MEHNIPCHSGLDCEEANALERTDRCLDCEKANTCCPTCFRGVCYACTKRIDTSQYGWGSSRIGCHGCWNYFSVISPPAGTHSACIVRVGTHMYLCPVHYRCRAWREPMTSFLMACKRIVLPPLPLELVFLIRDIFKESLLWDARNQTFKAMCVMECSTVVTKNTIRHAKKFGTFMGRRLSVDESSHYIRVTKI